MAISGEKRCEKCGKEVFNQEKHQYVCTGNRIGRSPASSLPTPPVIEHPIPGVVEGVELESVAMKGFIPLPRGRPALYRECRICGRAHHARGLCQAHYRREVRGKA